MISLDRDDALHIDIEYASFALRLDRFDRLSSSSIEVTTELCMFDECMLFDELFELFFGDVMIRYAFRLSLPWLASGIWARAGKE